MTKKILLLLIVFSFANGYAQKISKSHVTQICSDEDVSKTSPKGNTYGLLMTECGGNLTPKLDLYYVEIVSGTTFTFTITPKDNVDYDFAAWLNPDYSNVGVATRASKNDGNIASSYKTGLSLDEPEQTCEQKGVTGGGLIDGMVRYLDVKKGDIVLIAVNRFMRFSINNQSNEDSGYILSFGGDAILDCDIKNNVQELCDLNNDGLESFDLKAISEELNNAKDSSIIDFFENHDDAKNENSTNILQSPYSVAVSESPKTIYARYKRANGKIAKTKEIVLIINTLPNIPKEDLVYKVCDKDKNGIGHYNLSLYNAKLNSLNTGNAEFKYYENKSDAEENNSNTIYDINNYSSADKTIYIRMTSLDKCPVIIPLTLNAIYIDVEPIKIEFTEFCAEENKTGLAYNLQKLIPQLIDSKDAKLYNISFFNTIENAQNKEFKIIDIEDYFIEYGSSKTVYSRIENEVDCYIISEISFTVHNDNCIIPKGISPNGDNINDNWDLSNFGVLNLVIYNRYGTEVYSHSLDYSNQWHGQSNSGSQLPDGTYWYVFDSLKGPREGWVQINR